MTYFVILGKNKDLSIKELDLVTPKNLEINGNIAIFDTQHPEKLKTLAGVPKFGEVISFENAKEIISEKPLIGTKNQEFGIFLKKHFGIKRFKVVDELSSDLEVKEKGIEIFNIDKERLGIVNGYQKIDLYEEIDFKKPVSGMQIGMMPSKLAHIMINIGLGHIDIPNPTICDPFVGFGTTGFLANSLGYDFIGSDINATMIKQNLKRRQSSTFHTDKKITVLKHDINDKFEKNFLKSVNLIVTEGRLGPVVNHKTREHEMQHNILKIWEIYNNFINNVSDFWSEMTMCFSVPVYLGKNEILIEKSIDKLRNLGRQAEKVDIYHRKDQLVARGIILCSKK